MLVYRKKPLSITEQVELLRGRGLIIPDQAKAEHYLSNISYYRLSAYTIPFQSDRKTHTIRAGATFDQVLNLYVFDRALRVHLFDAIERIEVALRACIIQQMAMQHGPHWHEQQSMFRSPYVFDHLQREITDICQRDKREVFIDHYLSTYNSPLMPPCWMCFEALTMGNLSKIYSSLANLQDVQAIAKHFNLPHLVLKSWLHVLSYARNICAHHSRLWNRELRVTPKYLNSSTVGIGPWLKGAMPPNNKVFYLLCCIRYLLQSINPNGSFTERTKALLSKYKGIPLDDMGFQAGWEAQPLWRSYPRPKRVD
jgi:abortive infection bacteriophage resistance protein